MRQVIVSLFGFIPAFCLCILLVGALVGALDDYLHTSDRGILVTVFWCISGLIGTIALFFSIDDKPGPITVLGLGFGIATILATGMLSAASGAWKWIFVAPMVVASGLIVEGLIALLKRNRRLENQ